MTYIIHIIHISSPTVNDRQSPAVQLGKDFQKKSGLQRSNGHKWWWLVDMMSARSVFHSKVWHFNFSGNRTPVLPSLAISPLTVVLLQAGIKLWCFLKETWPPKPPVIWGQKKFTFAYGKGPVGLTPTAPLPFKWPFFDDFPVPVAREYQEQLSVYQ